MDRRRRMGQAIMPTEQTDEQAHVVSIIGCEVCQTRASIGACLGCGRNVCGRCSESGTLIGGGGSAPLCYACLAGEETIEGAKYDNDI